MGGCLSLEDGRAAIGGNPGSSTKQTPNSLKKSRSAAAGAGAVASALAPPKDVEDLRLTAGNGRVNIFTYGELRAATKNFRPDQILGEGGFGIVYKGVIDESVRPGFASTQVAVKELNPDGIQGDKEWLAEVNYLGQLSHPNLVELIGYCCEGAHRLLVYEYMACGSLEKHLFRRISLTMSWSTRMKIALGAAKGLEYLHGAERSIIYRDFKTSNILLDADYNAKLSDFGLARTGPMGDQTHVSTRVMGTYGYAAPEYVMTGHLTTRSDVYGFGVVLLEMLIGRRALDKSRPTREHNLVEWARPLLIHNRKLFKIIDPRMEGQYSTKVAIEVSALAYKCLSQNPKGRPVMSQVVETLQSLQDSPETQDLLLGTFGSAVTLYEVPKETVAENGDERREREREKERVQLERKVSDEKRVVTVVPVADKPVVPMSRRTRRTGSGRSKSEPPIDVQLYIPSPDSVPESPANCNGRINKLNEAVQLALKEGESDLYKIYSKK